MQRRFSHSVSFDTAMNAFNFSIAFVTFILLFCIVYKFFKKNYNYWKKQNIPCLPDPIVGFGHVWPVLSLKENIVSFMHYIYNSTNASMIGFYAIQKPSLLIRDPELIKSVLITNFRSFHDNLLTVSEKHDPARSKNPFITQGYDQWKAARARAINHFSSQKLRHLFLILHDVSSKFTAYIERKITESKDGYFECDLGKLFLKFTGEIVANAALSIEGHSFEDNPQKFAFTNLASLFKPSVANGINQGLFFFLPAVARFFGLRQVNKKTDRYFRENLKAAMKQRRQSNTKQNDYLQFCLDDNGEDNLDIIVADLFLFFVDVHETSGSVASSMFYFLAINKKVQDELRNDLNKILNETGGTVSYESLKSMDYLDQILKESLRLMPPLSSLMKVCTKDITLESCTDGLKCQLKPGDLVFISTMGLHMDSEHYPQPTVFDPERFSPENIASRRKYLYLPFNEGPRQCLGMRMATMMLKLSAAMLVTNFSIENSSKTTEPFQFDSRTFLTQVKGGLWAKFKKSS